MHAETDDATMYATLSAYTGHSVRYLRIRTAVRAVVATVPLLAAFASALPVK